jgi:hypothetical protein
MKTKMLALAEFSFVLGVAGTGTRLLMVNAFQAPGPLGKFKVSGMLGGKQVAVLLPEA